MRCEACFGSGSPRLFAGSQVDTADTVGYHIDFRDRARFAGLPAWVKPGKHWVPLSQAGLGSYERFVAGEGREWLEAAIAAGEYLVRQQTRTGAARGGWIYRLAIKHTYRLEPPWLSAMAQGEGASLLVRLYRETGEPMFAEAAASALEPLARETAAGGVRAALGGLPFYEEYPTDPPSFVLNGAFFALWGAYDVWTALDDEAARAVFEDGVAALAQNLELWDSGYWSRYDLFPHRLPNLASPDYHALHTAQLAAMHRIAPGHTFDEFSHRFAGYAASPVNVARALAAKAAFRALVPRHSLFRRAGVVVRRTARRR